MKFILIFPYLMQELQSSFTLLSFTSQLFISYFTLTPYLLLTNSHFRKKQNLLNLHLLNKQK
ncbi:hypothetical protein RhiirC2_799789 [Rhizophagus irregularis]|uniref:Uncharacterized protein n=1 Tax=Rhizophagus irregularis TaxID=588596 RepID=A0A2N1M4J2_9GLOM|nr:hypothetical protein RhiirC2_799789 [Rhizophagus irregularis]